MSAVIEMVRALQICVGILFLYSFIGHCHGYRTEDRKLNGGDKEKGFNQSPLLNKLGDSPSSSSDKGPERTVRIAKRVVQLSPVQKAITIETATSRIFTYTFDKLFDAYQNLRKERLQAEGYMEFDNLKFLPNMLSEFASELRDELLGLPNLPNYNDDVSNAERMGKFKKVEEKFQVLYDYANKLFKMSKAGKKIHTNEDHLTKDNIIYSIERSRLDSLDKGEILPLVKEQDLLRRAAFNLQGILPTSVVLPKLRIMLRERERDLGHPLNEYEKTEVTWNWVQKLLGLKILISKPKPSKNTRYLFSDYLHYLSQMPES